MKRIFTFIFTLVSVCTFSAYATIVDGTCGDNLTWTLNTKDSTLTISGTGEMTNHIPAPWYNYTIYIKYVTIGDGVTSIGSNAFYGCSYLTSVTIPNSVTSIGVGAFGYCYSLTSPVYNAHCFAYMPTSYRGAYAIPEGIKQIAGGAFYECSGLTSITIPNSVTSIGRVAFSGCSGLTSITIPNSVTSIRDEAFRDCSSLTSVTIGYCVTSIGKWAFRDCSGLTSITIPKHVTWIGEEAFLGCSGLTSITIPNSVTSIGDEAFRDCSSLTSVTIGNSVTSIGEEAFLGCSGLTSIESLAEIPPTLGSDAFYNVSTTIPVYVPCGSVSAYQSAESWNAFTNIQETLLPKYSITVYVKDNTNGNAKVNQNTPCDGATISATANYGYHFTQWSDGNTDNPRSLVLTQNTTLVAEFTPNQYSITTTSSHSERGTTQGDTTLNYLEYTTISATPNYGYHFSSWNDGNTDNPRVVQVTEDTTYTAQFDKNIYTITTYCDNQMGSITALDSAEYLDEITISATANYRYHFSSWSDGNTDNPRTLVLTQDTTFTAEFAVSYSGQCGDNLYWAYDEASKTIAITGSGDMYDYTKDTQPWLLFQDQITEVTTSNTTTSIGDWAFADCSGLTSVSIGNSITSIGDDAFSGCSGLTSVTIGNSITSIGDDAFSGCSGLTSVTIGNSVTSIGNEAFAGCSGLREISLGSGLKTIGAYAFMNCPRIYEVTCLAQEPPVAEQSSFTNYDAYFHAPCDAQRYYSVDPVWKNFHNVECIVTDETVMDDITITPSDCEATVVWLSHDQAATYSLVITKKGETYCTLTFNKYGQLINIALAPARVRAKQDAAEYTETGYSFTITGLEMGTTYDYTFAVLNDSQNIIDQHFGHFTTTQNSPTDLEHTHSPSPMTDCQKIIHNGQLLILRDGKIYTVMGQEL